MTDLYNSATYDSVSDSAMQAELESRQKEYIAPDRTKFILKAINGEGLWSIHRDKGQIPAPLQGRYTSIAKAQRAIDGHAVSGANQSRAKKVSLKE